MSQRDSGYARKERDLYETPEWVTQALLPHVKFGSAWEPACGSGKMARVIQAVDPMASVMMSDIETDLDGAIVRDFLTIKPSEYWGVDLIVTNPPYELATEFCEHALRLQEPGGDTKVAMLLRTDFDHAKSRSHLFRDCPAFAKKLVLTRRIVWFEPEPGAKGKSPSFNHAWFIWDWRHEGAPTLAYGP